MKVGDPSQTSGEGPHGRQMLGVGRRRERQETVA